MTELQASLVQPIRHPPPIAAGIWAMQRRGGQCQRELRAYSANRRDQVALFKSCVAQPAEDAENGGRNG